MPDVNQILNLIPELKNGDKALITKAYDFAYKAHEGQLRNSGEPYFIHVVETAKTLANLGMDAKTIASGLLHDVIEDTKVTEDELRKEFGDDIITLVRGVTKLGTMKYRGHERHVESLRKFFMAMANDLRILIIKLADRLHNVQTLQHIRPDKQKRIALETIEIHARLADRIGMGKLKGDLEDASFPYAYPKEYEEVNKLIADKSEINKKELQTVAKDLKAELDKQKINIVEINQRAKHKYSLWQKLKRYDMDIDKIYDLIALRIIVDSVEDCYRVLGIVHSMWRPLPGRIKDYIANPKPNNYRSLHTTIFTGNGALVEIQIRTPEMHAEAAYGIAAHFVYKEKKKKKNHNGEQRFEWIDQLRDLHKTVEEPKKFIEHLKTDLFQDRIFVFTPKGDVVDLPSGSSPIDFAYAIHSDIGDHAQSAKINEKIGTLYTVLHNNDVVEIKVQKNANPSSKWLDHTKTTMAKKHINQYLNKNSLLQKFRSFAKF
ncbi:bifunctional (p)ppGpp synthetase/guanosine-3',5'-bis(diphosphate) 3'-pyrophosphohydrolase [Candidatus Nomurabacteria bacterium]|nr:bifunctional (p)ppGpp synthetase/guanosine-3',5'-bis(diphosphate) 3'-pyrophosphohydrolase [Candidatus Nomurabacteria bacterium]